MATSSVLSKCKRKGLFQTNFPEGLSGSCTVRTVMKNFLYPVLCLSRQFAIKVSFPWSQNNTDFYPKDPLLCRLCGSVLLYRRLKLVPDGQLDPKEFLKAVKDCVFIVSGLLSQLDPDRTLSDLFGPRLDKIFKDAFTTMSDNNLNLHLEVSNVSNLHITGVRSILGPLEPSKNCYVQEILGQKVYLEPADMEKLHKKGAIFLPQDIVEHLVQKFQIGVKFITKEKFYVTRSDGGLVQGSVSTVRSHHMWTFESPLNREKLLSGQYPLSWRVADMDLWVHYRLPHYRKLSAFFKSSQRP